MLLQCPKDCECERICGVVWTRRSGELEHGAEHVLYLLLVCSAISGDACFELRRARFEDGDALCSECAEQCSPCLCNIEGGFLILREVDFFDHCEIWRGLCKISFEIVAELTEALRERQARFGFYSQPFDRLYLLWRMSFNESDANGCETWVNAENTHGCIIGLGIGKTLA